jgi:molecular chaperone GrpE
VADDAPLVSDDSTVPAASSDPEVGELPGAGLPVEPTEQAVQRLNADLADQRDRYLRLAAEYDNFRKRNARERADLSDKAQGAFAIRLLEVLDDLDRVVGVDLASEPKVIHEALLLIDRKLRKELEAAGLERLDPVGQPFDPALHEAVHVLPPPEPARDHTVAATFQSGYRFKGALIRPARVQVYSSGEQD